MFNITVIDFRVLMVFFSAISFCLCHRHHVSVADNSKSLDLLRVLWTQNISSAGAHKALSPGCFSGPLPLAPAQVIQSKGEETEPRRAVRSAACPTYGRQGGKAWLQLQCLRHSSPKGWLHFKSLLLIPPAQNSGKYSRVFFSQNKDSSFGSQCTVGELLSCLYFPHDRTSWEQAAYFLYPLLDLAKFFHRLDAKYVLSN